MIHDDKVKNDKITVLIVDSHALIHRAYHAIPPLTTKSGIPTNALYGYLSLVHKAIVEIKPTHLVACFDTPTESFRAKIVADYQATRKPTDDALKEQFPIIRQVAHEAGMVICDAPGYEADDAIATATKMLQDELEKIKAKYRIIILTGDKDMLQLVDDNISVLTPQIGFSKSILYTPKEVVEKMGVTPEYVADLKALMGDTSDNYKGLRNIGPKTAAKLIHQYGHIEQMGDRFNSEEMDIIHKMKIVSTVVTNVSTIDVSLSDTIFDGFHADFVNTLRKYELFSLIPRIFKQTSGNASKKENKQKISVSDQSSLF
jgi:5'-3' exonuclease